MLMERYRKAFTDPNFAQTGDSARTPIYVTNLLNSIKSYFAICLLCNYNKDTAYYNLLEHYKTKNYVMIRNSLEFNHTLFTNIDQSLENDYLLPIGAVAAEQISENDCPECQGNVNDVIIEDTIFKMKTIISELKKTGKEEV